MKTTGGEEQAVEKTMNTSNKNEEIESAKAAIRQMLMPPPQPILSKKTKQSNDIVVNTGLNILFRRAYAFSQHPDSGGEPLGPIPSSFVPQSSVVPALDFTPVT